MECAPARRCTANRAMNGLQEYAHPESPANTVALALGQAIQGEIPPREKDRNITRKAPCASTTGGTADTPGGAETRAIVP